MRIPSRLFARPRVLPLIATVLVVALGIALGNWQTQRAHDKEALGRQLAARQAEPVWPLTDSVRAAPPAELEFRRVRVRGHFLADWPLYLDNRPHDGHAGVVVLMPFEPAGSARLLWVERGWVARDPTDRSHVPLPPTPFGELTIEGTVVHSAGHVMQLGQAPALAPYALVQNATLAELERASGRSAWPFFIEQHDSPAMAGDGLVRDWPAPSLGIEKHRAYALQWYALALMAVLFFIATGWRRRAHKDSDHA